MRFNMHSEEDFDGLMLVPLAIGVLMFLLGGWGTIDELIYDGELEWDAIYLTLAGAIVTYLGVLWYRWIKS